MFLEEEKSHFKTEDGEIDTDIKGQWKSGVYKC